MNERDPLLINAVQNIDGEGVATGDHCQGAPREDAVAFGCDPSFYMDEITLLFHNTPP
jgi:hypothetical protein